MFIRAMIKAILFDGSGSSRKTLFANIIHSNFLEKSLLGVFLNYYQSSNIYLCVVPQQTLFEN